MTNWQSCYLERYTSTAPCHVYFYLSERWVAEGHAVTSTKTIAIFRDYALRLFSLQDSAASPWDAERHLHCGRSQCSESDCGQGYDCQAIFCDTGGVSLHPHIASHLAHGSKHHLVQRKRLGMMSMCVPHFALSLERGNFHKSLCQQSK